MENRLSSAFVAWWWGGRRWRGAGGGGQAEGPEWWAFLGARARPGSVPGAVVGVRSDIERGGLPAERGELARDGDRDHAGGLASLVVQVPPAGVQAPLGAPGDLDHAWVLPGLAARECLADAWRVAVVLGGLDQQSARMRRAGLGDRSLPAPGVGGALGGHDPEEPRQQGGPPEASPVADLGAQPGGRQCVDAAKAAQPGDHRRVAGLGDLSLERRDQARAAEAD